MWSSEQVGLAIRVSAVLGPIALYFMVLGLLNSRRHPQILPGRMDFALLIAALSPLLVAPAVHYVGLSAVSLSIAAAMVALGIVLLAPRGQTWVIYNLSPDQARQVVTSTLKSLGLHWRMEDGLFRLEGEDSSIRLQNFPLLRNVSVRFTGDEATGRLFGRHLSAELAAIRVETSPMAAALLLVATGMMLTPLTLMANHAGQIVRILTDLLY